MNTIYFLGDAILDNFYWLSDKKKDLKEEVTSLGFDVINYAVDDTRMVDIFNGIQPKETLKKSRKYPYPIQKDGKIYPLKSLLNFKQICGQRDDMVVISIGGIDIQSKKLNLLLGADKLINSVVTEELKTSFRKLFKQFI